MALEEQLRLFPRTLHERMDLSDATLSHVCDLFGIDRAALRSPSKATPALNARAAAAVVLQESVGMSTPQIARALGRTDHTTAMNSLDRARKLEQADYDFRQRLGALRRRMANAD